MLGREGIETRASHGHEQGDLIGDEAVHIPELLLADSSHELADSSEVRPLHERLLHRSRSRFKTKDGVGRSPHPEISVDADAKEEKADPHQKERRQFDQRDPDHEIG